MSCLSPRWGIQARASVGGALEVALTQVDCLSLRVPEPESLGQEGEEHNASKLDIISLPSVRHARFRSRI
jgi:hypothetical protein